MNHLKTDWISWLLTRLPRECLAKLMAWVEGCSPLKSGWKVRRFGDALPRWLIWVVTLIELPLAATTDCEHFWSYAKNWQEVRSDYKYLWTLTGSHVFTQLLTRETIHILEPTLGLMITTLNTRRRLVGRETTPVMKNFSISHASTSTSVV